ncbi:MAG: HEAT repeat domain-containing protein [Verrucomicrobiota bacterium]
MKSHYLRWKESWTKDGPDNSILEDANGDDLEKLESDLIANLGTYEALALAKLGSKNAVPHIERMIASSRGSKKAAYSCALMRITGNTECIGAIISVLCPPEWLNLLNHITCLNWITCWSRIDAAHYLEDCHDPRAFDALEKALSDSSFLVRANAAIVFSKNSAEITDDSTIIDCVGEYNKGKIRLLAKLLRSRIYGENKS